MVLTLLALLVGAGIGCAELARRGALDLTGWQPWRRVEQLWLIGGGVVLQALAESFDIPLRRSVLVIGLFALIVGLAGNLFRLTGAGVTIVGLTANLLALVANGHVPVRLEALIGAGVVPASADPSVMVINGGLAEVQTEATRLGFLGDIIPLPLFGDVVSFGDLIVLAGVVLMARSLALDIGRPRPHRAARPERSRDDSHATALTSDLGIAGADDGVLVGSVPGEGVPSGRVPQDDRRRNGEHHGVAVPVGARAERPAPSGDDEGLVAVRPRRAPTLDELLLDEPTIDGLDAPDPVRLDDTGIIGRPMPRRSRPDPVDPVAAETPPAPPPEPSRPESVPPAAGHDTIDSSIEDGANEDGTDDDTIDVDDFLIDLREAELIADPAPLQPAQTMSVDELLGPDPSSGSSARTTRS